jgi:hypothetical protein
MDGDVAVDSAPGAGATFTVTLDGVRHRQPVPRAKSGRCKRDRCVEIDDEAGLGEGDHPIGLVLAGLPSQPFCQFKLHDRRHHPLLAIRQFGAHRDADRRTDQPFDPGRGIDQPHQTRSVRSR